MDLFNPKRRVLYTHRNPAVGKFWCITASRTAGRAVLQNAESGWTFVAHNCRQYADGKIDWDYSTGGEFRPLNLSLGMGRT